MGALRHRHRVVAGDAHVVLRAQHQAEQWRGETTEDAEGADGAIGMRLGGVCAKGRAFGSHDRAHIDPMRDVVGGRPGPIEFLSIEAGRSQA